jgi:hypothetical protein
MILSPSYNHPNDCILHSLNQFIQTPGDKAMIINLPTTMIAGDCNQVSTETWGPEEIKRLIQIGLDAEMDRCDERVIRAYAALERAIQAQQQKITALSEGKF